MGEISQKSIDIKTLKIHFKTSKFWKINFHERKTTKSAQRMLDLLKFISQKKSYAHMMNIGQIITKKTIYDNMQMSFWAKI